LRGSYAFGELQLHAVARAVVCDSATGFAAVNRVTPRDSSPRIRR
jgi:hypothetical protein